MSPLALLALLLAAQDAVVLRTAESPDPFQLPAVALAEGEIGILLGSSPEAAEVLAPAGFLVPPFVRGKIAVIVDPKAAAPAGTETVVWVTSMARDQAAAVLRASPGIRLCIVTGRGGGDATPLKIGESWMVQAPGSSGLWGRLELRGTSVTHRWEAPSGKYSEAVAAARKSKSYPVDLIDALQAGGKKGTGTPPPPAPPECANRGCKLRILGIAERPSYGARAAAPGKSLLVLDTELENIIPLTLVRSHQIPTIYRIKELGDHLYLVVDGIRVARLFADATSLPGHLATSNVNLERLGSRMRGNLVFEVPSGAVRTLDLRFYDYAHGHMSIVLRPGAPPEGKPLLPLQENDVLEAGLFRAERTTEIAGKKAPEGMTYLALELRARSRMFTEGDATAFDPKAKPGDKLQIGTVSDWTDLRRHLNILVDGVRSYGTAEVPEIGEAPRFIPDILTGGAAVFLVPEKVQSMEVRCDFPNAKLPSGQVVHPKALSFLLEGKRPEPPAAAPILEIDDQIFKVAVTGQAVASEFAGVKAPGGTSFLILDVLVTGGGLAGEMFQTVEQLHYTTEKGAQLPVHEATFKGPSPPSKLHLVPTGERRLFQVVFAIPSADRKPRLAYKGVTKAVIVDLKPLEGSSPEAAKRLCPKCKVPAAANEKFCAECGTKLNP